VLQVPGDFFYAMGLEQVLTHQRLNGLAAILAHMKRLALNRMAKPLGSQRP
jgi:cysteine desulfuration protein SufE